ncbi:MAG: AarF/ABC1/UbiB kinase family protein [Deltaproteobacteria bacterium]|nr:AarF/ABC1/UbiB kinase family protein [Deltaproteobacteria bacterium]MCB9785964.1 AarF/ABC1/UbiB kinase family protein [Deltaproteobacteria bacterium]
MVWRVLSRALRITAILTLMLVTWIAEHTGLRWLAWRLGASSGAAFERKPNQVLVREAFERMGPTFIKLGQVVASSPGLFPRRYSDEFQRCLDRVPSFDLATLRAIVADSLGQPIDELFRSMEDLPLGSASIAQVHGAELPDGTAVVVKVQRPNIADMVDADLWWMRRGAAILERLFEGARLANLTGVIEDFDRTIHEELDFRREADNQREFNRIMALHGITDVRAPVPVEGMVTERVLVMERFFGIKADDVEALERAGIDAEVYLRKGLRAWLLTVMLHGYFHGDAHAGNLMMLPDGPACGFLDFGIVGRFNDAERHAVMRYVLAFAAKDYEALANVIIELGAVRDSIDRAGLVRDLEAVYSPLLDKTMSEIRYEEIMPEATRVAYRYGITLPGEFLLILKQLLFFDRYAKLAAPGLNVFSDFYLVDFLFTPQAAGAGIDFNLMMPLLRQIQERHKALVAEGAARGEGRVPAS